MDDEQQAQLDQQVAHTLAGLQAAGESVNVEGVARTLKRRTADVLDSIKRLTRGTPGPEVDADTPPEHYPNVQTAAAKVAQLTEAVAAAEVDVTAAEQAYAEAEAQAAEALIDGREPISLMEAQQAVLAAAETVHLLQLAQTTAKDRYTEALQAAKAQCWALVWGLYQDKIRAFDEALGAAYEAQEAARLVWNQIGQPGEVPLLKGPLSVWPEHFHPFLQGILDLPAEEVQRGTSLAGVHPQPRSY